MKLKVALSVLGASLLLIGFQNCGGVKFAKGSGESLVLSAAEPDGSVPPADNSSLSSSDDASGSVAQEGMPPAPAPVPDRPGNSDDRGNSEQPRNPNAYEPSDDEEDDDGKNERLFVCVVEGPGKSHKAAYVNGEIIGKVGTPADICMTEKACLTIVSQVYPVKGAYKRGFCPDKNPHVVHFSDDKIQELVNKLKP